MSNNLHNRLVVFEMIKKFFSDFNNRKKIQYLLLTSIVALQLLMLVLWYNESYRNQQISQKVNDVKVLNQFSETTNNFNELVIESQGYFNQYLTTHDPSKLELYFSTIKKAFGQLKYIQNYSKTHNEVASLFNKKNKTEAEIMLQIATLDSTFNRINSYNGTIDSKSNPDKINSEKILDDLKTNTFIKIDSVPRKNLITRLGQAISGKMDVQKEQKNVVVTLKYLNKLNKGTFEEQIQYIINETQKYYKNELLNLKTSLQNLNQKNAQLVLYNNKFLIEVHKLFPVLNKEINLLKNNTQQEMTQSLANQKTIRTLSVVFITLLMMLISLILFGLTKIEFEYENKLREAHQKINESLNFKNRIINMLSHEIRSPLSMVSMYSKNVADKINDDEIKQTMQSVEFTTNSLLMLSGQIIEASKSNQSKPQLVHQTFDLNSELFKIIAVVQALTENNGNQFVFNNQLNQSLMVTSDQSKIHQLFYNLVGNANKFTQNGSITVTAKSNTTSEFETELTVAIADNGIGISKENVEKIFNPHYQDGTIAENKPFSMGIGLSICKEIVELFDGTINAESSPKKGTTITFTINLAIA